jgi:hypothetical protein
MGQRKDGQAKDQQVNQYGDLPGFGGQRPETERTVSAISARLRRSPGAFSSFSTWSIQNGGISIRICTKRLHHPMDRTWMTAVIGCPRSDPWHQSVPVGTAFVPWQESRTSQETRQFHGWCRKMGKKKSVYNVHAFGFGSGRISAGLGRTG